MLMMLCEHYKIKIRQMINLQKLMGSPRISGTLKQTSNRYNGWNLQSHNTIIAAK